MVFVRGEEMHSRKRKNNSRLIEQSVTFGEDTHARNWQNPVNYCKWNVYTRRGDARKRINNTGKIEQLQLVVFGEQMPARETKFHGKEAGGVRRDARAQEKRDRVAQLQQLSRVYLSPKRAALRRRPMMELFRKSFIPEGRRLVWDSRMTTVGDGWVVARMICII